MKHKETARERYLQQRYNMSENEYNARLLAQDNQCLLCGVEFNHKDFGPDSPVVDHCHTHGHVRGILCNECNRGLGYFHDNPAALRAAALYIEEN
jgi:nitrate/TMAO reductase-like tetraheme cytochrome c subunit